tara:strand:+ start:123 stop:1388 length:1266 start_codon:yes stop_codon:yes gene_type:complete
MGKHRRVKSDENSNSKLENNDQVGTNKTIVWAIFSVGFIVILLSVCSAVFPGLLISISGDTEFLEPFEISPIGAPIIAINITIISLIILYNKQLLPKSLTDGIEKIFSFELSNKNSLVFLIIILAIYISISASELSINEINQYGDYLIVEDALRIWPDGKSDNVYVTEQLTRHVRMALLSVSDEIFDNVKVIPYIASIFLLITTYFLTIKFSKKNFTGIIAVILVLQSSTFLTYDTIAVYENFWVLFYVFSIYLIFQKPKVSSVSYLLSIFSKAITILILPVTIIVTLLSDIPKKKKVFVITTHVAIVIISIAIFQFSDTIYGSVIDINTSEFLTGFSTLAFNLRFDVFLLLFLLPVSIGLFLKARNGSKNAISLMVLMGGIILVTPVLEMMTNFYFVYPYRYMPLVVFFAISVSSLFSKR